MMDRYTLNFGQALDAIKRGAKVARAGWNGRDMYIFLGRPEKILMSGYGAEPGFSGDASDTLNMPYSGDVICMRTAQATIQVGWLASQADMLACDWQEIP